MDDQGNIEPKSTISGDELFMETFPVHPMVACFIALPLEHVSPESAVRLKKPKGNILMKAGDFYTREKRYQTLGMPSGMGARRVLLYFFSMFYKDQLGWLDPSRTPKEFISEFGYDEQKNRRTHIVKFNFLKILKMRIQFADNKDNVRAGFHSIDSFGDCMVSGNQADDGWYETISYNPSFLFKMAFPVDFNQVVNTRKKSHFWNAYLFLVDVLPRIEPGKSRKISWTLMHDVFYRRYKTLENFRYNFRKTVDDVYSIYPKARGKVDLSRSDYVTLRHAKPPIEPGSTN